MSARPLIACRCCGGQELGAASSCKDRDGGEIQVRHCLRCEAVLPEYQTIGDETVHQAAYHAAYWSKEDAAEAVRIATELRQMVRLFGGYLESSMSSRMPVLEIGAGRCCLMKALKCEGFIVEGCEPSAELVGKAREIFGFSDEELHQEDAHSFVTRINGRDRCYDAVFMWHVIEHLTNPLDILRGVSEGLGPDGIILLQAPLFQQEHVFREHLYLFSPEQPKRIADILNLKLVMNFQPTAEGFVTFALSRPDARWPQV